MKVKEVAERLEVSAKAHKKKPRVSPADLPPGVDPLLSRAQVCAALGMLSMQTFDRMVSAKEFPRPDARIGVKPMWKAATVNAWIGEQCNKKGA